MPTTWTILVPLKPLAQAKSRLRGAMPQLAHEDLVRALALSTVAAAQASAVVNRLIMITNEPLPGLECLPDRHGRLNDALQEAARLVTGAVAVIPADLPALRTVELTEALRLAVGRCFVPDSEGTGTVLLAAPSGPLLPRFGTASALAHERSGARRLAGAWPTLRRDVDTASDLAEAVRLGWNPSEEIISDDVPTRFGNARGRLTSLSPTSRTDDAGNGGVVRR